MNSNDLNSNQSKNETQDVIYDDVCSKSESWNMKILFDGNEYIFKASFESGRTVSFSVGNTREDADRWINYYKNGPSSGGLGGLGGF